MIGRNGHQRWPEALEIVHQFWRQLPPSYRFNRKLQRYEELYADWDCSVEGFEGIRSQDILPLLLEYFQCRLFIGFGNVIDPFVDRAFGFNFDAAQAWDRSFIDRVHQRDREEIVSGRIGPTHMLAVLGSDPNAAMMFHAPLTPAFCLPKSSGVAGAARIPQEAYEWGAWPHPAQSELEIACGRLSEAEVRSTEQMARVLQLDRALEEQTALTVERTAWALQLERDLEERTAWALQLNRELEEQTALTLQRTDWAQQLSRELEEQTALALERTGWALQLNREIEDRTAREAQFSEELERLSWARAADRRFHRPLSSGFRMAVYVRDRIRQFFARVRAPVAGKE
jgi:hypothetical protein